MAFKLGTELTEKQIEADVATYFGWITPIGQKAPFRLLDIDEQLTGADKLFNRVIPMYIQFKKSEGLAAMSKTMFNASKLIRNSLSPLNKIREFRRREGLYDTPTLYFQLHQKAEHATDYQHNILHSLANTGFSHAFYLAPLTLSLKDYETMLFDSSNRYRMSPFYWNNHIEIYQEEWLSHLGFVPFLRAHISIPPHEKINTHHHYYSFSPTGTEIGWHSPTILSRQAYRLSDMLYRIFRNGFSNRDSWLSPENIMERLRSIEEVGSLLPNVDNNPDQSSITQLQLFGKVLYEKYQIRQLMIATSDEKISTFLKYQR